MVEQMNETIQEYIDSLLEDLMIRMKSVEKQANSKKEIYLELYKNIEELKNYAQSFHKKTVSNLQKDLNELSNFITKQEQKELTEAIQKVQTNRMDLNTKRIEKEKKTISRLVHDLKIENETIIIRSTRNNNDSKTESYKDIMEEIIGIIKNQQKEELIEIKENSTKKEKDDFIKKIEEFLKETHNKTEDILKIEKNLKELEIAFFVRENHKHALAILKTVKIQLKNENQKELKPFINKINQLEVKYKKENEEAITYINQFNFSLIEKEMEKDFNQKKAEEEKEWELKECERLSYELEKAKKTQQNKILEIERELNNITKKENLEANRLELMDSLNKGRKKFLEEEYDKEEKEGVEEESTKKARIAYETELEKEAIKELKQEGYYNSFKINIDNLSEEYVLFLKELEKKKEELIKFIYMSPTERGIYDLKKSGELSPTATENDLNSIQKRIIPYTYQDESYEYIKKYKEYKKLNSQSKDTIYKEYLKYRSSLKDKTNYMTFEDFKKEYKEK